MPYCSTTVELQKVALGEVVDPKVVQAIAQELIRARKKLSELHEDARLDECFQLEEWREIR